MDYPIFAGIFLTSINSENLINISSALHNWKPNNLWKNFQSFYVDSKSIANIIPFELQQEAKSWLIIYRSSHPKEVLIIPYPKRSDEPSVNNQNNLMLETTNLLNHIIGDRLNNWFPANGYINLVRKINRLEFSEIRLPSQFQLIRFDKPITDVLNKTSSKIFSSSNFITQQTIDDFITSSEIIQSSRHNLINTLINTRDQDDHMRAISQHESLSLKETQRLSGLIPKVIPSIVDTFKDVIDNETLSFLVSSATVSKYAKDLISFDFDFSLPGCGLWKSVERELNSSIIWHLRRCKEVIDVNGNITHNRADVDLTFVCGQKDLNLNKRKRGSDEFEDISMGDIGFLLYHCHDHHPLSGNSVIDNLLDSLDDTEIAYFTINRGDNGLSSLVRRISYIRNAHSHIKKMDSIDYDRLHDLILYPEEKPETSLLGKILYAKRQLKLYWQNQ